MRKEYLIYLAIYLCVVNAIGQVKECYYVTWDGTKELLCSTNLISGVNDTVGAISGVTALVNNTSTFNSDSGYYIFQSNLGITIVNTVDASIVDTFNLPNFSYKLLEYSNQAKKCYYLTWDGSDELLCSMNLTSGVNDTVGAIPGVTTLVNNTSTFNSDSGYYIFQSNLGITIVNTVDASIVDTFNLPNSSYRLLEYSSQTKKCYYVIWDGSDELLCSMNLTSGINDTVGIISGVNALANNTSAFDDDNGYYIFQSNLGITIVNTTDASVVSSNSVPILSYGLLEYKKSNTVGIKSVDIDFEKDIMLYPNPTNGDFSIQLKGNNESVNIKVWDTKGNLVQFSRFNSSELIDMELEEPPGLYLVEIESTKRREILKLIKN